MAILVNDRPVRRQMVMGRTRELVRNVNGEQVMENVWPFLTGTFDAAETMRQVRCDYLEYINTAGSNSVHTLAGPTNGEKAYRVWQVGMLTNEAGDTNVEVQIQRYMEKQTAVSLEVCGWVTIKANELTCVPARKPQAAGNYFYTESLNWPKYLYTGDRLNVTFQSLNATKASYTYIWYDLAPGPIDRVQTQLATGAG